MRCLTVLLSLSKLPNWYSPSVYGRSSGASVSQELIGKLVDCCCVRGREPQTLTLTLALLLGLLLLLEQGLDSLIILIVLTLIHNSCNVPLLLCWSVTYDNNNNNNN